MVKESFQKGDDGGFDGEGHQEMRCNSSNANDYVLMTSNKQITVFEFLMFMRLDYSRVC